MMFLGISFMYPEERMYIETINNPVSSELPTNTRNLIVGICLLH